MGKSKINEDINKCSHMVLMIIYVFEQRGNAHNYP